MIKHILLLTFRRLKGLNTTLLINIISLSTGLACAFLIYLWIADELAVDKFHQNGKRLFQLMQSSEDKGNMLVHEGQQYPLAAAMMQDLPEVEAEIKRGRCQIKKMQLYQRH